MHPNSFGCGTAGAQNFIVTPSKEVETGEEVKVKFEAVNEADVEKTKTFRLIEIPLGPLRLADVEMVRKYRIIENPPDAPPLVLPLEEIDFKTVTLTPGETEIIEFTFVPKETGEYGLIVKDQIEVIEVTGIPGFEAVLAIAGLLAVAYLLRRRK